MYCADGSYGLLELCTLAAPTIYVLLTIVAILSVFSPFLSQLASHGKTRFAKTSVNVSSQNINSGWSVKSKIQGLGGSSTFAKITLFFDQPKFQISKRYFVHFYSVGIFWSAYLMISNKPSPSSSSSLSSEICEFSQQRQYDVKAFTNIVLLFLHLTRRCYECVYVHEWNGTMHIAGFFLGLLHYLLLPFVFLPHVGLPGAVLTEHDIVAEDVCDKDDSDGNVGSSLQMLWLFSGIALNIYAQYQQYVHHCILANCRTARNRKKREQNRWRQDTNRKEAEYKSSSTYTVPEGNWFMYVSCPHYLAEIMIYISFVILLHDSVMITGLPPNIMAAGVPDNMYYACDQNSLIFHELSRILDNEARWYSVLNICLDISSWKHLVLAVWVTVNLAVSARSSHAWYQSNFPDYPRNRAALFPFIW